MMLPGSILGIRPWRTCRSLPQMLAVVTRTMASSGLLDDRLRHLFQPDVARAVVDDRPHTASRRSEARGRVRPRLRSRRPSVRASTTYSSSLAMQPVTPGRPAWPRKMAQATMEVGGCEALLLLLGGPHAHAFGADDFGGHDRIHGDVVAPDLGGQGPGEAVEAGLGGRIHGAVADRAGAALGPGVAS